MASVSARIWDKLNQETPKWKQIIAYYQKNKNRIDVNYAPKANKRTTILFLACLKKQMGLAKEMMDDQLDANFCIYPLKGPHKNKSILLFLATVKQQELVKRISHSDHIGSCATIVCEKRLNKFILQNLKIPPIDKYPKKEVVKRVTPLWLAAADHKLNVYFSWS